MQAIIMCLSGWCIAAIAGLAITSVKVDKRAQDPDPDCVCGVVNKSYVIGDCTCELAGGNGDTEAVSISTTVFQGGDPISGTCGTQMCGDATVCTYRNMDVTITVASCARECSDHSPEVTVIPYTRSYSQPTAWTGTPSNGGVTIGTGAPATSVHPNGQNSSTCGSGPFKDVLVFKKADGQTLAEVVFEYGCGKCKDSAQ